MVDERFKKLSVRTQNHYFYGVVRKHEADMLVRKFCAGEKYNRTLQLVWPGFQEKNLEFAHISHVEWFQIISMEVEPVDSDWTYPWRELFG